MSTYNGEYNVPPPTSLLFEKSEQTETSLFFERVFTIKSKSANIYLSNMWVMTTVYVQEWIS